MDRNVAAALQDMQQEIQRLRQREAELTQTVQQLAAPTSPVASTGDSGALAELIRAQQELVMALKQKESIRLVDNRGLGKPEKFGGSVENFLPWKIRTQSYLCSIRRELRELLTSSEEQDQPITSAMVDAAYGLSADELDRIEGVDDIRKELADVLLMLTEKEPFDIIINSADCGLKGWRRLNRRFDPSTGGRKRALLTAILSPSRAKMDELPQSLEKLLDSIRLCERRKDSSGNRSILPEDVKINVLERVVPAELERHLVLNRDRFNTFSSMLGEITAYVEHQTGNRVKVFNSQAAVCRQVTRAATILWTLEH